MLTLQAAIGKQQLAQWAVPQMRQATMDATQGVGGITVRANTSGLPRQCSTTSLTNARWRGGNSSRADSSANGLTQLCRSSRTPKPAPAALRRRAVKEPDSSSHERTGLGAATLPACAGRQTGSR
jgi:hypothetical protein